MKERGLAVRLLFAGFLLLTAVAAPARQVLHEAAVPVPDRSEAARDAAVREALGEVLVRLSGDKTVLGQAGAAALLAKAGRYLQQYQYEEAGALTLRAGFDGAALEAAMREQGLSLWGRTRSPLLIWLAVDDGSRRFLLASGDADPLADELRAAAQRHGLDLILPLVDLEDQSRLGYSDVADRDLARLEPASQRYQAQAILAGYLQRVDGTWSGRWAQSSGAGQARWQNDAAELRTLLEQGLGQAAERLAPRTPRAPVYSGFGALRLALAVEAVEGLDDYARIVEYLQALPPVSGVSLIAAQPGRLEFLVDVQGGAAALDQSLVGGAVLEPAEIGADGVARYRLRR